MHDLSNLASLPDIVSKAETTADNFVKRTTTRIAELKAANAPKPIVGESEMSSGELAIVRRHISRAADTSLHAAHKTLLANTEAERLRELENAKSYEDTANRLETLYDSPASMLKRSALGDARRANLQATLAGAGPAEIRSYTEQAIVNHDVVLAAAVATAIDRMPSEARKSFTRHTNHSVNSLGKVFMQEPFQNAKNSVARLRFAARKITYANKSFLFASPTTSLEKITAGLMQQQIQPEEEEK